MKTIRGINMHLVALFSVLVIFAASGSGQTAQERESPRLFVSGSRHTPSEKGRARLVIYRIPNLGNRVIVDVWIDGVVAGPINYGDTLETYVSAGPHVLTVLPTPNPNWHTATQIPVYLRAGQTNSFTAASDHSGYLILLKGSMRD
jgi:hypothetical protein